MTRTRCRRRWDGAGRGGPGRGLAAELGGGTDPAVARRAWQRCARSRPRTPWSAPTAPQACARVARDRRISIEDAQMRHGRKTKRVRIDGHKRHVLTDLDRVHAGLRPAPADLPRPRHRGVCPRRQGPVPRPGLRRLPAAPPVHHQCSRPQRAAAPRRAAAGRAARRPADPQRAGQAAPAGQGRAHPGPCGPLAGPPCPLPRPAQEPVRPAPVAVVHNLHVIARQPPPAKQAA
jgi:hypothetical protein